MGSHARFATDDELIAGDEIRELGSPPVAESDQKFVDRGSVLSLECCSRSGPGLAGRQVDNIPVMLAALLRSSFPAA